MTLLKKWGVLLCVGCIKFYQLCCSPLLPSCCRFVPTCSHYAKEAIMEHGVIRGITLGILRMIKCHPWGKGGYDPVRVRKK